MDTAGLGHIGPPWTHRADSVLIGACARGAREVSVCVCVCVCERERERERERYRDTVQQTHNQREWNTLSYNIINTSYLLRLHFFKNPN